MPLFEDRTRFCLQCGAALTARSNCPACGRRARPPVWAWPAFAAAGATASSVWAHLAGVRLAGVLAVFVTTIALAIGHIALVTRHPRMLTRKDGAPFSRRLAAMLLFCVAVAIPALWAVSDDPQQEVSTPMKVVLTLVVLPVLIALPVALLGPRYGKRMAARRGLPVCPACDAFVAPSAVHCGLCGARL